MRRFLSATIAALVVSSSAAAAFAANVTSTHPRPIATHVPIVLKTNPPGPQPHPTPPHKKNPNNH